ncbi:hypothetical protein [Pseudoalteromonas sp. NZS11_1]|uniref:hypothetical protein n=1 Tax=Pseudoalteromonas sp. NZS11_1 TaxID=2792070 RepID=UPI0018CC8F5A|nr:hypothetical protein [Pseudoalteromonas sp. NZS11_1]MBH0048447.1 hypothetical protein [Pseudoalteromonas sp. NZS11_1]
MDLKEFISESIVEIVEGIVDAQSRIKSDDALIVPSVHNVFTQSKSGGTNLAIGWDKKGNLINSVEFDVAVTSSEGTETKGGIGVVAGIVALGSQGKSLENNQSISRLKFRIPISFPRHDAPET